MNKLTLCAAMTAFTLLVSACAPPADQAAQEAAAAAELQASELAKAQADLAAAQEEAAKKQAELDAAQARARKAERAAREERAEEVRESAPPPSQVCNDCGTVASINEVRARGEGSGLGAVAGAVLGGVIGHQIGGGRGKDVATGVGAIAGGMAGHQVERSARAVIYYEVGVQMENGGYRTVRVNSPEGIQVGTAVRVNGNDLQLR